MSASTLSMSAVRASALAEAISLPAVLIGLANEYLDLIADEDKLAAFLEDHKHEQKVTIPFIRGHAVTIYWGRSVQTRAPKDVKKKRYKVAFDWLHPRSKCQMRYESRRTLPMSSLLPGPYHRTQIDEIESSCFRGWYRPAWRNLSMWRVAIPRYRKAMAKLLARF